jgi:hypothetical protein
MAKQLQHPGARKGEVWIGNFTEHDFDRIGLATKRLGMIPVKKMGSWSRHGSFFPVFVQRQELEKLEKRAKSVALYAALFGGI